jgi:hypothetical protein
MYSLHVQLKSERRIAMALTHLDKKVIGTYLSDVWKQELGTAKDPANRRWYEDGANHSGIGLYGGLTDTASTELIFDESQKAFTPESVVCDAATVDNRNGLAPQSTVELSHMYGNTTTTTHSTTNSIKAGVGLEFKAKATIFGIGGEAATKISFEYTHSWTDSTSVSETESHTFKQSVPINVPSGKVYQVVLTAKSQKLTVPYRALIYVHGMTETWFEGRVNGHYNWSMSAGEAFEKIGQWGKAGPESFSYGRDPKNGSRGVITQQGKVTAQQTADFVAQVYDITDSFKDERAPRRARVSAIGSAPMSGKLVQEIPF